MGGTDTVTSVVCPGGTITIDGACQPAAAALAGTDWHQIVMVFVWTAVGGVITWAVLRPRLTAEPRLENQSYIVRVVVPTLAFVIVAVTVALLRGLFDLRSADDPELLKIIGPSFQIIVGAFVGFLGGYAAAMADGKRQGAPPRPPEPPQAGDLPSPVGEEPEKE